MSLRELCFATALFACLRGADRATTLRHAGRLIGPDARSHLKRAFSDLDREDGRMADLRVLLAGLPPRRPASPAIRPVGDG